MHTYIYSCLKATKLYIYPCCVTFSPLDFKQHYSLKTKPSVSNKTASGGLRRLPDQAYNFQHQKLPLYAQSREPSMQGMHGRPFRTNTKMASGGLKMTTEAAGTRSIIFSIKSYLCMTKAGSHSIQGMAGHSGQTGKQTNNQIPLCF